MISTGLEVEASLRDQVSVPTTWEYYNPYSMLLFCNRAVIDNKFSCSYAVHESINSIRHRSLFCAMLAVSHNCTSNG
jgi:hypothetical protein